MQDPPLRVTGFGARQSVGWWKGGFEVGFHTVHHERLPDLPDDALAAALRDGVNALESVTGGRLSSIAYPHGRADQRVAAEARRAGFEIGFTGAGEVVSDDADPLLLPRIAPTLAGPSAFGVQMGRLVTGRAGR